MAGAPPFLIHRDVMDTPLICLQCSERPDIDHTVYERYRNGTISREDEEGNGYPADERAYPPGHLRHRGSHGSFDEAVLKVEIAYKG